MRAGFRWAVWVLIVSTSVGSRAQVNVETLKKDPFQPGWGAIFESSFAVSAGNVNVVDLGGSAKVQHQTVFAPDDTAEDAAPWVQNRLSIISNLRFAQNNGEPFISQGFGFLRLTHMWTHRFGSDFFSQAQFNKFLRLQERLLLGAGVRFEIIHTLPWQLSAGTAYMLEHEKINVEPGAPDDPNRLSHRSANYVTARTIQLDGQIMIQNTFYLQPRFDAPSDFRLLDELELAVKLTGLLSIGLTTNFLFNSAPPTGVQKSDFRLLNTLRLEL